MYLSAVLCSVLGTHSRKLVMAASIESLVHWDAKWCQIRVANSCRRLSCSVASGQRSANSVQSVCVAVSFTALIIS